MIVVEITDSDAPEGGLLGSNTAEAVMISSDEPEEEIAASDKTTVWVTCSFDVVELDMICSGVPEVALLRIISDAAEAEMTASDVAANVVSTDVADVKVIFSYKEESDLLSSGVTAVDVVSFDIIEV